MLFSPGENDEGEGVGERRILSSLSCQLPLSLLPDENNMATKVLKAEMCTGLRLRRSFLIRPLSRAIYFPSSAVFRK